ncbi:MAG: hypothetical protein ACPIOQ_41155 [Promethearchaeia archaeon]
MWCIEQICPFPYDLVADTVKQYSNADIYWVQVRFVCMY